MKKLNFIILLLIPIFSHAQFTFNQGFSLGYTGLDNSGDVAVDTSGNVYLTGTYVTYIDLDPGPAVVGYNGLGFSDGFLAKYSPSGSLLWSKSISGPQADGAGAIDLDDAGNVYVIGGFADTIDLGGGPLIDAGNGDMFIVKYSAQGQYMWSKRFGGPQNETAYAVKVSENGNFISICGSFENIMDMGNGQLISNGSSDAFIALLDAGGNSLWSYGFGGNNTSSDRTTSITMDNSYNVYASGVFTGSNVDIQPGPGTQIVSSTGSGDIFVMKFNSAGTFQNAFTIGGTTGELAGDVVVNDFGDIYITGYSNSDSIDVDPSAAVYYLYGQAGINFGQDIIVVKYNATSAFQWGFRIGKRASDVGQEMALDPLGNIFITGASGDSLVDFDPGPGTHFLDGDATILAAVPFLAQYSGAGNLIDAFILQGKGNSFGVDVSDDGKVWITGSLQGPTMDLDPGPNATVINNAGLFDVFCTSYNYPLSIGLPEYSTSNIFIYPNPFEELINIESSPDDGMEIKIYDITGKLLKQFTSASSCQVSLQNLEAGVYVISVMNDQTNFTKRIIKQ